VAKATKQATKRRSLEQMEADLNARLKKITLLKTIRANREELKALKTKR
jgi:hypothetical protein